MNRRLLVVGGSVLMFALTPCASAAWPSDPMVNLAVATSAGEQTQPKVVDAGDGGVYVSWFDGGAGGYDVYLQRIDANGSPAWKTPLLVADRSFSSTQDYGLSVDATGHALLAFRDDRFGGVQVTAARISPSGDLVWGANGVQLTNDGAFKGAPKVAGGSDGSIYVAWTHDAETRIAQLDASGVEAWSDAIADGTGLTFTASDLHASDAPGEEGEVILLVVRGGGFTTPRHLYVQKYDASGERLWSDLGARPVFTSGSLQFGNFPTFVSDGEGGAVIAWYSSSPSLQCYVQHMLASGEAELTANGFPVSTNASRVRVSPDVAYDGASDSIYVAWIEQNSLQSVHGVYAQRISGGARQWTDEGAVIVPLGNQEMTQARAVVFGNGLPGVFYVRAFGIENDTMEGVGLDAAGTMLWSTDVATETSDKSRLVTTVADGQAILAWADSRNDFADIYVQNVQSDGSLGGEASTPADLSGDGFINGADLAILLTNWGPCGKAPMCPADLDGDGSVNGADLAILLTNWS